MAPERGIGAVLAGDVYAAEESLKRARRRLELVVHLDAKTVADVVALTLREVLAAHEKAARDGKRTVIGPLSVLLGMIDASGGTIIRLESLDDFAPHFEIDVQTIGSDVARKAYEERLRESDASFMAGNGEVRRLDVREGAMILAGNLVSGVIEPQIDHTVGGQLQVFTITQTEWMEPRIERLKNIDFTGSWETVNIDLDRVRQYMRDFDKPPLAAIRELLGQRHAKRAPAKAKTRR